MGPEKVNGGDLGFFSAGERPPEFDQVFSMEVGTISEVIKSPYGYHIFKLEEKIEPREIPFEEAKAGILQELGRKKAEDAYQRWLKELRYFWPRPSAIDYDPLKPSGGSNLGPTSQKLKAAIEERKQKVGEKAPPELLYASGSGLDPHIGLETSYFQIPGIAKARSISEADLKNLVDRFSEGRQLGFLGAHYVNVSRLNQALDEGQ